MERPILFSSEMVRAILDGRKTQTRRVMKPQPFVSGYHNGGVSLDKVGDEYARFSAMAVGVSAIIEHVITVPYAVGDRLYVREAHKLIDRHCDYRADWPEENQRFFNWRPSIHMPRWASRLTLTVTDVRVQRLQDISEADAMAEGCDAVLALTIKRPNGAHPGNPRECYCDLWNSLHGPGAWDANPWVVALTFTVQRGNIDQIGDANG